MGNRSELKFSAHRQPKTIIDSSSFNKLLKAIRNGNSHDHRKYNQSSVPINAYMTKDLINPMIAGQQVDGKTCRAVLGLKKGTDLESPLRFPTNRAFGSSWTGIGVQTPRWGIWHKDSEAERTEEGWGAERGAGWIIEGGKPGDWLESEVTDRGRLGDGDGGGQREEKKDSSRQDGNLFRQVGPGTGIENVPQEPPFIFAVKYS